MRVAANEMIGPSAIARRVADREQLVLRQLFWHCVPPAAELCRVDAALATLSVYKLEQIAPDWIIPIPVADESARKQGAGASSVKLKMP
jgi:hypothetical protein